MRSDSTNEERMCNPLEIYDVNMDYLGKKYYTQIKEMAKHSLEKLLYIFVNTNHEELDEIYEGNEIMEAVKEKLYNLESELDRLLIYDRDKFIAMTIQEQLENDFREEERKEREKALKEAKQKEQKKRISSAKRLYSSGIPLETIIECLSLSSNESKLLKKDLGL